METLLKRTLAVLGIIIIGIAVAAPAAQAQRRGSDDDARWFAGFPRWTLELYGGLANQGRFLLEALDGPNGVVPQRELRAENSFSFGGSVGATILPRTSARLAFTRTSTDLEYRDDTGDDSNLLDQDDVAGLSSNVLSLEVIRQVLSERTRLTPYGGLGIALTWWNLDERGGIPLIRAGDGDETLFRFGGSAVLGLQYRASRRWKVRLEATTFAIRNPFTGSTSYVPVTGFIIDEPAQVRQTNFRLGVAYTFPTSDDSRRSRRSRRRRR